MLYVEDIALMHDEDDDGDHSALQVSASLASDCVRVFGPGDLGEPPILSQAKSSYCDVNITFLRRNINTHTGQISLPYEKIGGLRDILDEWTSSREATPVREVLSLTGNYGT